MQALELIIGVAVFLAGMCIGSFLNVCIYRIPLGKSVVYPGSHCSACGTPLAWNHNLPVVGWLFLRGRAACCGTRIDVRYAVVELTTGLLFVGLWARFPWPMALAYAVYCGGLIVASCIDIDHFIIPDRFTLGGAVAGMIASALVPSLHHQATAWTGFIEALRGAVVGGVMLWAVAAGGSKLLGKEAMGFGDVKLMAAFGAFLGWPATIYILVISSMIGSVFGVFLILRQQRAWGTRMPYGPFLALASLFWIFGGAVWTQNYLIWLGTSR
jgi:leader peptidase (prepilin peptidase)/N-methyltransferase